MIQQQRPGMGDHSTQTLDIPKSINKACLSSLVGGLLIRIAEPPVIDSKQYSL